MGSLNDELSGARGQRRGDAKSPDGLVNASNPVASGAWGMFADVAIGSTVIGFGSG